MNRQKREALARGLSRNKRDVRYPPIDVLAKPVFAPTQVVQFGSVSESAPWRDTLKNTESCTLLITSSYTSDRANAEGLSPITVTKY